MQRNLTVAALAVQLSREDHGLYKTPHELAEDAAAILYGASWARRSLGDKQPNPAAMSLVESVAARYSADVIVRSGGPGMFLGLRFRSGRFSNGSDNVFFVT